MEKNWITYSRFHSTVLGRTGRSSYWAPGARRVANFWVATCHTSKIFHSLSAAADARAIKYSFGPFSGSQRCNFQRSSGLGHAFAFMTRETGLTLWQVWQEPRRADTPHKKCNFQTAEQKYMYFAYWLGWCHDGGRNKNIWKFQIEFAARLKFRASSSFEVWGVPPHPSNRVYGKGVAKITKWNAKWKTSRIA